MQDGSDGANYGIGTRAIHAGQAPDPTTGAVMPPIYATSSYAQSSPGVHQGFEYSRTHNPTRFAYERCIAGLEGGTRGLAFASGLAATATLLELLDSGDHVIAMDDLYGGSFRLFERVRRRSAAASALARAGPARCGAMVRQHQARARLSPSRWAILPSLRSLTVAGMNSVAGSSRSMRGRKAASQHANSSAGKQRFMHKASVSAGERNSSPPGSHASQSLSPPNHPIALARKASASGG